MFRLLKISSLALAAALFAAGCETVERARTAQAAVSSATNDVPGSVHARLEPGSVNLLGSTLVDYVAFAMTNRPSLEASRLAVSNAVLELARVTSDRALQLSLSGGYSQATRNGGSHFSWHQPRGRGTTDISADLLICDFGRLDARERQAREELVAAQRDLADEEFSVFNEVAQAYFTVLRNDGLLAVAHTNEFMFAEHLRHLLLAAPLGEKKVLAIDPGIRTGCKVAMLDATGKFLVNTVVYPMQRTAEAQETIAKIVDHFHPEAIAVGNGTAGRETEAFSRMGLTLPGRETVYVHPTFLYESLWNLVGLLLLLFVVSKGRRFDGENTWFYFLWYGLGRFWIEGLRTDILRVHDVAEAVRTVEMYRLLEK